MSDLDIALQEIEMYQSCISSCIYTAKREGNLKALEGIVRALDDCLEEICREHPEIV